jgi:mRNA-degrading endonuclease RelE of RelBE toxin-antitoxin system
MLLINFLSKIPCGSKIHFVNTRPYRRADCGEYRIIYRLEEQTQAVHVILVGKRNGGEVYQRLKKLLP